MKLPQRRRAWTGLLVLLVAAVFALGQVGWNEPPRFDGAGYATLARALALGAGYRSIDQPDRPAHVNFPPGYPLALAGLERLVGPSIPAFHAFSVVCSLAATGLAWLWFRRQYPRRVAAMLGLALACNWIWSRTAGEVRSEPLYLFLQMLALLLAGRLASPVAGGRLGWAAALGLVLGLAMLTRQVGIVLLLAVTLAFLVVGRWGTAAIGLATAFAVNVPWFAWQAAHPQKKQIAYFLDRQPLSVALENALFYARRMPDMLTGPFVEVATVFEPRHAWVATVLAVVASAFLVGGWLLALGHGRRRPGALFGLGCLAMLLLWPFTEAGRFLIPLAPMLLMGAVEGLACVVRGVRGRPSRQLVAALLLAAALPYALYALASGRAAAQRRLHEPFDAACGWIATQARLPGPLLTAYPGEAFLQTGRLGVVARAEAEPDEVQAIIDREGVVYLLVAPRRFANPPDNPLIRFVNARPERVSLVYGDPDTVAVYEVVRPAGGSQPPSRGSPRSSFR